MTNKFAFKLSTDAKSDLIEIRRFTKKTWGIKQSQKYINELKMALQSLSENSEIGKRRSELGDNVFSFPYVGHVVYYTIFKSRIIVFGVLHKSMIPFRHLQNRDS